MVPASPPFTVERAPAQAPAPEMSSTPHPSLSRAWDDTSTGSPCQRCACLSDWNEGYDIGYMDYSGQCEFCLYRNVPDYPWNGREGKKPEYIRPCQRCPVLGKNDCSGATVLTDIFGVCGSCQWQNELIRCSRCHQVHADIECLECRYNGCKGADLIPWDNWNAILLDPDE